MSAVNNYVDGRDLTQQTGPSCGELVGRKVMALPRTLWSGLVLTIAHFVQALFRGLVCNGSGAVVSFKKMGLDLKEAGGHFVTLFNDRLGCQIVEEARNAKSNLDAPASERLASEVNQGDLYTDLPSCEAIMEILKEGTSYNLSMVYGNKAPTTRNAQIIFNNSSENERFDSIIEEIQNRVRAAFKQDSSIESVAVTFTVGDKSVNLIAKKFVLGDYQLELNTDA